MIKKITPISSHWPMQDPFLFCAHHLDHYPAGNGVLGLDESHFHGRQMGSDFEGKDGFSLYHGAEVPGFPVHPHRGFETVTIVRRGFADHADSLGSVGRYGEGDVQWMTAGRGVQHSEMFPLLHEDKENTLELFQLWLNLPKKNKMVDPGYRMLWSNDIPRIKGEKCEVTLICGEYGGQCFVQTTPHSWAHDPTNQVGILLVKLEKGGKFTYPAKSGLNRSLYFYEGGSVTVNGEAVRAKNAVFVDANVELKIVAAEGSEFALLEAKPINEPVVQHGPFVMNTREEIMQAMRDYQSTEFGGWSYKRSDMVHGKGTDRFAQFPDGKIERPSK